MKTILLATLVTLSAVGASYSFAADSYDDVGPSADAVTGTSGTGAINDNGNSTNGNVQGTDTIQDNNSMEQNLDSGISRDGETLGDED